MPDLFQEYGGDLALGPSGDLLVVSESLLGQQRVLRRLLTNTGDYLWNPSYGAGLARFIGQTANAARIRSIIRSQIFQEAAVARQPEPTIDVQVNLDGRVAVQVLYADSVNGQTQVLSFSVGEV